jgi:hypothetical protein
MGEHERGQARQHGRVFDSGREALGGTLGGEAGGATRHFAVGTGSLHLGHVATPK